MLFRTHKATKGVQEGHISYDDRAYLKLRLIGGQQQERAEALKRKSFLRVVKSDSGIENLNPIDALETSLDTFMGAGCIVINDDRDAFGDLERGGVLL